MRSLFVFLLIICFSSSTFSQAESIPQDSIRLNDSVLVAVTRIDSILMYADKFVGCRYGYGNCGPKSFDCSGFVMHVFGKYHVQLPHTSQGIGSLTKEIKLKKVRPGDLLFFSGRKVSKKKIGHVAIVKEVDGDEITMIHATVQSGVITEKLDASAYFTKRFIRAGRLDSKLLKP